MIENYFSEEYDFSLDNELISKSLSGDKKSLEQLVKRHQNYIYNISLKLFLDPNDALDATQEVLIKVITSLNTFKGKSQFRTWLYRIAFNHFLDCSAKKMELTMSKPKEPTDFAVQEMGIVSEEEIEEVRILCSTAMLMCLSREQRLLYIVGEIFGADHNLGATLFGISKSNFRIKLYRAKTDLLSFVSGKCGLLNPANSCRCPKKAGVLVKQGVVNKKELRFNTDYQHKIAELVSKKKNQTSDYVQLHLKELFQDSPFQIKKELDVLMNELVK